MGKSLSELLQQSFSKAGAAPAARTRIDARTAGFPTENEAAKIQWMGMSPIPGTSDGWRVIVAEEEPNQYLVQVNENERLVEIVKVLGKDGNNPFTFEEAVERLAVWEFGKVLKGEAPAQKGEDLGRHYFKDPVMRRSFLVSTIGAVVPVTDVLPTETGKFLKSDLDALQRYREALKAEDLLAELIQSHNPLYISENAIEEDLEGFGEIGLFDKMRFFTEVLVQYAAVKLQYVQDFYADPNRRDTLDLDTLVAQGKFFSQQTVDQLNEFRTELASGIFRYFHVAEADWDEELDMDSQELRIELRKNPDAKVSYDYLTRVIDFPMQEKDIETMLFLSARALVYFREMLKDSPQKDALEMKGVYRQTDLDDLLNFLDLLEIKRQYMDLAEAAIALPGTQKYKDLNEKKTAFQARVGAFKKKIKAGQDLSPMHEQQIDSFIKASTPIYLLERIGALPEKIEAARRYIMDRILPPQY